MMRIVQLEELLQSRLQMTRIGDDPLSVQASATDLFHLYAGNHNADDASLSSSGADRPMTIKREALSPTTTDLQSEDSGVDVSVSAASAFHGDRRLGHKRKQPDDGCPTAVKSSRTDAATVLSVNVAVQQVSSNAGAKTTTARDQPFRPWSCTSEELSLATGLRLFHDIRNVDRIRTLTQRQKTTPPPTEPQPLDLTSGGKSRVASDRVATAAANFPVAAAAATIPVVAAAMAADVRTDCVVDAVSVSASTLAAAGRQGKNMSRARRIEANARERSRVHTISAAFDTLRATVPSYSKNQKLSKLSTIRVASAYIQTLSRMLDLDYSAEQDGPSVEECVRNVSEIIQTEGKTKKRKDERLRD